MRVNPSWQIDIATKDPFLAERILPILLALGATGLEEVLKRRKIIGLRAYLPRKIQKTAVVQAITDSLKFNVPPIKVSEFRDRKWEEEWKKFLKPVYVGRRIFVRHDPNETLPKNFRKDGIILDIKPTFAFGTGQHATTFLCLRKLIELSTRLPFYRMRCLDLGSGTGILSLALHRLGAKNVLGLDNDPMAVEAAKDNAKRHRIEKGLIFKLSSLKREQNVYDLIVANIMLQTHLDLCASYRRALKNKGKLILSGLLVRQEKEMRRCLEKNGFLCTDIQKRRGWIMIEAQAQKKDRRL